jgi:hypothetical protein
MRNKPGLYLNFVDEYNEIVESKDRHFFILDGIA